MLQDFSSSKNKTRIAYLTIAPEATACSQSYRTDERTALPFPQDLKGGKNQLFSSTWGRRGGEEGKKTANMVWLANRWTCGLGVMDRSSILLHLIKPLCPSLFQHTCSLPGSSNAFLKRFTWQKQDVGGKSWQRETSNRPPSISDDGWPPDYTCLQMKGGF